MKNSIKGIQIGFEILKEYKSSVLFSIVLSIATGVIAGAGFSVLLPILTLDSLSTSVSIFPFLNDFIQNNSSSFSEVIYNVAIFFLIICVFEFVFTYFNTYLIAKIRVKVNKSVLSKTYRSYLNQDYITLKKLNQGDVLAKLYNYCERVAIFSQTFISVFSPIFQLIIFVYIMFKISAAYTVAALIWFLIMSNLIKGFLGRKINTKTSILTESITDIQEFLIENIQQIKLIKISSTELSSTNKYDIKLKGYGESIRKLEKVFSLTSPMFNLINSLAISVFLLTAVYIVPTGSSEWISTFFPFLVLVFKLIPLVSQINSARILLEEINVYYSSIMTFSKNSNTKKLQEISSFQNMKINKLNYSEDSYDILKNIDFEISSGDFIGIMGSSGSGKSTFLDIVSGIYSNYNGQILVNDSLIDFKKHSIASLISYMPQETMLFNLSIKENIVFGKDYDEVKFTTAVKTASVDEIISTVKNGENYIVGKNGNLLSGGQRQRIALARAIYNDSEVILLDEATSNLDLKLDEKIFTNLNKLKKTFIVTSHRISSIINADCIYLFEDGEIVDSGKHDELLAKNKKYQIIYELENLNND
tara:strand:+ start:455 stop:2221 length:1767 start_codon:yes stop_codon:yes gene_type:complete